MLRSAYKIAAVLYIVWGVIHVAGGAMMLDAAQQGPGNFMSALSGTDPEGEGAGVRHSGFAAGSGEVFSFHSFNIVWLGILSIVIALAMNWKNSKAGYWMNMAIVGFADIGLIVFMVIPGIMKVSDAWIGPVLFCAAVAFSSIGQFGAGKRQSAVP